MGSHLLPGVLRSWGAHPAKELRRADYGSCAFRGRLSIAPRNGRMRTNWLRTPATPWEGCETERPWGKIVSLRSTCARLAQDIYEHLRRTGCMVPVPKKAASSAERKECQRCFAGVSLRQDLLENHPEGSRAAQRHLLTDRALLFHQEDAQGTDMCGSPVHGHQSGLLHCLCGDCVGWFIATRHEGAAFRQSRVKRPNWRGPPRIAG